MIPRVHLSRRHSSRVGFSLVEVMAAMGILGFTLVGIIGLFSVGLIAQRDSKANFAAANTVSVIVNRLKAAPFEGADGFAIDRPLTEDQSITSRDQSVLINLTGERVSSADANAAKFRLLYRVTPPEQYPGSARVWIGLFWPPVVPDIEKMPGRYEVYTEIYLSAKKSSGRTPSFGNN